jgi:hypothetical protein
VHPEFTYLVPMENVDPGRGRGGIPSLHIGDSSCMQETGQFARASGLRHAAGVPATDWAARSAQLCTGLGAGGGH